MEWNATELCDEDPVIITGTETEIKIEWNMPIYKNIVQVLSWFPILKWKEINERYSLLSSTDTQLPSGSASKYVH